MEPIEQALKKAREQRRAMGVPASSEGAIPNFGAPVAVAYTQTKVIPLKPTVLERNRVVATQLTHPVTDIFRSLRAQVLQGLT